MRKLSQWRVRLANSRSSSCRPLSALVLVALQCCSFLRPSASQSEICVTKPKSQNPPRDRTVHSVSSIRLATTTPQHHCPSKSLNKSGTFSAYIRLLYRRARIQPALTSTLKHGEHESFRFPSVYPAATAKLNSRFVTESLLQCFRVQHFAALPRSPRRRTDVFTRRRL